MQFYKLDKKEVFNFLESNENGLTNEEANKRLAQYGLNEITKKKENKILKILTEQVNSFVVYILIAAVIISLITKNYLDAIVIASILILNTTLGFIQEYRAEKSIESLKKLETKNVLIIRDKKQVLINSKFIVPGDIIIIEEGIKIPADSYLLECYDIEADESILTGESVPVKKQIGIMKHDSLIAEQLNMLFSSTTITKGRGKAIVANTGMNTELGKIASLIQNESEKQTPLQKKLDKMGKTLGILVIIIAVAVFFIGLLDKQDPSAILLIAISLAVGAIPEGLPAIVTISLALGTKKMIKRNVLIRKLSSVETLGSTNIICADKTGTMTQNKMQVTKFFLDNKIINLGEESNNLQLLHNIMGNCNTAVLPDIGDSTELGILRAATKAVKYEKIDEIPFSSKTKTMITYNKVDNKIFTFAKFDPEKIYDLCSHININGKIKKFTPKLKKEIMNVNDNLANQALRVLGYAYFESKKKDNLIFVGLTGMIDPPRQEVEDAIKKCKEAGIKVIMITGDHKLTAQAIARQIGLNDNAITGEELEKLNDNDLKESLKDITVYARVNPEHKVRILNALYNENIIAMTGDGVNDAPALKKAHIGVAIGSGTDVAKEASDMIILDNNFNSIVYAVEEGRSIYDNIKKFINYLLSSNLGEVLIIFVAMILAFIYQDPRIIVPLTALHILWINLVTDGMPALALGVDSLSSNIMKRSPRNPKENIITKNTIFNIITIGILMTIIVLTLFRMNINNIIKAQTIAFTTVVMLEMTRVQMIRSQYKLKLFSNKWLWLAILFSILLQLLVVYLPSMNKIFKTVPLSLEEWGLILLGCLFMLVFGNLINYIIRKATKQYD